MGTSNFFIAFLLIVDPSNVKNVNDYYYLGPQMRGIAINLELMDDKEQYYTFFDFKTMVNSLNVRWEQCRHLPRTHMHYNFPIEEVLQARMNQNMAYMRHLENLRKLKSTEEYLETIDKMIRETQDIYATYSLAYWSKLDSWYITARRSNLQKLLDKIGPQRFYSGCLPPHVPLQYFQRID